MTEAEFRDWLFYHGSIFRSLGEWIAGLPSNPPESMPSKDDTLLHWFNILKGVELEDAKAATDGLATGSESEPRSRDHIPGVIAKIARRLHRDRQPPEYTAKEQTYYIEGEPVVECLHCEDVGLVICWHPDSVRAVLDGTFATTYELDNGSIAHGKSLNSCAVRCSCRRGDLYRGCGSCCYDPARWCKIELGAWDDKDKARLVEWVAARLEAGVCSNDF